MQAILWSQVGSDFQSQPQNKYAKWDPVTFHLNLLWCCCNWYYVMRSWRCLRMRNVLLATCTLGHHLVCCYSHFFHHLLPLVQWTATERTECQLLVSLINTYSLSRCARNTSKLTPQTGYITLIYTIHRIRGCESLFDPSCSPAIFTTPESWGILYIRVENAPTKSSLYGTLSSRTL